MFILYSPLLVFSSPDKCEFPNTSRRFAAAAALEDSKRSFPQRRRSSPVESQQLIFSTDRSLQNNSFRLKITSTDRKTKQVRKHQANADVPRIVKIAAEDLPFFRFFASFDETFCVASAKRITSFCSSI